MAIYFIKEDSPDGNIKIGSSKNPKKRLKQIQTSNSRKLTLIKSIEAEDGVENTLQHRFGEYRVRGEWFRPEDELLSFIETLQDYGVEPDTVITIPLRIPIVVLKWVKIVAERERYASWQDLMISCFLQAYPMRKNRCKYLI